MINKLFFIVFFLLLGLCKISYSQPIYLNRLIDSSNINSSIAWRIVKTNNKYIVTTDGFINGYSNQGILFYLFDTDLDSFTTKSYYYNNKTLLFGNAKFNDDSTKLLLIGGESVSNYSRSFLFQLNLSCDSLKYFTIGDTIYSWRIIDAIETNYHGFILVGGRSKYPMNNANTADEYPIAMEIDSLGNVVWLQTYPITDRGLNLGIQKTLDGNYLINSTTSIVTEWGNFFSPTLIKINSIGEMLWSKTFGGNQNNNGRIADIIELPDSTLVFETGYYKFPFQSLNNNNVTLPIFGLLF